jgi:hypothetical protein
MKSSAAGKRISARKPSKLEVLSVSPHGIWLYVAGTEYLLSYDQHPWFLEANVNEIFDVRLVASNHLWWPALDVDLHIDSLAHPDRFPLMSRVTRRARPRTKKKRG